MDYYLCPKKLHFAGRLFLKFYWKESLIKYINMKQFIMVVLFGVTVLPAVAQVVPDNTGSQIEQNDAQATLEFHNKVRNEVGVPALQWSAELANYAQEWADYLAEQNNCKIAHRASLSRDEKDYGENIFWGSGKKFTAKEAAEAWYSEKDKYEYQPIPSDSFTGTGHYTQMIWKGTREIGIGISKCSNGATIIVANYSPAGNIIGEKPY